MGQPLCPAQRSVPSNHMLFTSTNLYEHILRFIIYNYGHDMIFVTCKLSQLLASRKETKYHSVRTKSPFSLMCNAQKLFLTFMFKSRVSQHQACSCNASLSKYSLPYLKVSRDLSSLPMRQNQAHKTRDQIHN